MYYVPKFHLVSHTASCGAAQDAVVSSQLFMLQNHSVFFVFHPPRGLRFNFRNIVFVSIPCTLIALHLPQNGLLHCIHSTSSLRFRPRVTALGGSLVSALSATNMRFFHTLKKLYILTRITVIY